VHGRDYPGWARSDGRQTRRDCRHPILDDVE